MKLAVPDTIDVPREQVRAEWAEDMDRTRSIGDSWLESKGSALLAVPSFPSPESTNYLLNPLHREAALISIEWCKWIAYDKRLFHVRS
jgi:RES domain-containing protein